MKTNERPGTKAVLRHSRMSATKARVVLDLIRDQDADRAAEVLRATPREAAGVIGKVLASAVANAAHNDGLEPDALYVSACFADEGTTLKRWRPRARGRATRIRKRTCHITVIVSRLPEERLARRRAQRQVAGAQRSRRVAESRRRADLAGRLSRRRHAQEEAAEEERAQEEAAAEAALVADAAAEQAAEDVVEAEAERAADETTPEAVATVAAEEVATEDLSSEGTADDDGETGDTDGDDAGKGK
ncbi:MAG: 50S ribosomal protein L22 [Acidimicrobiales bacterium]